MIQTIEPIADSMADAAARLGISRSTIYVLAKNKEICALKVRGRTIVSREEQDRFLRSLAA